LDVYKLIYNFLKVQKNPNLFISNLHYTFNEAEKYTIYNYSICVALADHNRGSNGENIQHVALCRQHNLVCNGSLHFPIFLQILKSFYKCNAFLK